MTDAAWYSKHISQTKNVCGGKPVVTGTRVLVSTVLSYLAAARPEAEILDDFPTVTAIDIKAIIAFSASCAMVVLEANPERFSSVAARKASKQRVFGGAKGLIRMHDDFDDPLPPELQKSFEGG